MSSQLGGSRPAVIPFSGDCDANGNLTLQIRPRSVYWWTGKAVIKTSSGTPAIELFTGPLPIGFGAGSRSEISGLLIAPGEVVTLNVIGAGAEAAVAGTMSGREGASLDDVSASFLPVPNTLAVTTSTAMTRIGLAPGANQSLVIPNGAVSFAWTAGTNNVFVATLTIQGNVSNKQYATTTNMGTGAGDVQLLDSRDTALTVSLNTISGTPALDITFLGSPVGSNMASSGPPPPWQAPRNAVDLTNAFAGAGATKVYLPAVVSGEVLYLHTLMGGFDATTGGADLQIQDTGGTLYGRIPSTQPPFFFDFKGMAFPINLGFQLVADSAAQVLRGILTYSRI